MHYIYKITVARPNKDSKIYIGQTIDLDDRWLSHKSQARKEKPSMIINYAMKKYGIENCKIDIIDFAFSYTQADCIETCLIEYYKSHVSLGKGYNVDKGGHTSSRSEETKNKISFATKGENNPFFRKTHTNEIKQKLSQLGKTRVGENSPHYGKNHSEETKNKISLGNIGKKRSKEVKQKISLSLTGENNPFFGKTHTEEIKQQLRGENAYNAKLTNEQVMEIRNKYQTGNYSHQQLADEYLMQRRTIGNIINGIIWKHLPYYEKSEKVNKKLSEAKTSFGTRMANNINKEKTWKLINGEQVWLPKEEK